MLKINVQIKLSSSGLWLRIEALLTEPLYLFRITCIVSSLAKLTTINDSKTRITPKRYKLDRCWSGMGHITKSIMKLEGITNTVRPTVASIGPSMVAHFAQKYSNKKQESIEYPNYEAKAGNLGITNS
jgi:hypothetical protein